MNTIQNATWTNTKILVKPTASQKNFSNILHQEEEKQQNTDGETKTVIQRSVITSGDGSQIVILTKFTLGANGQKTDAKVISRMKIGKNDNSEQPTTIESSKNAPHESPLKNVAGNEYDQNNISITLNPCLMFKESI